MILRVNKNNQSSTVSSTSAISSLSVFSFFCYFLPLTNSKTFYLEYEPKLIPTWISFKFFLALPVTICQLSKANFTLVKKQVPLFCRVLCLKGPFHNDLPILGAVDSITLDFNHIIGTKVILFLWFWLSLCLYRIVLSVLPDVFFFIITAHCGSVFWMLMLLSIMTKAFCEYSNLRISVLISCLLDY